METDNTSDERTITTKNTVEPYCRPVFDEFFHNHSDLSNLNRKNKLQKKIIASASNLRTDDEIAQHFTEVCENYVKRCNTIKSIPAGNSSYARWKKDQLVKNAEFEVKVAEETLTMFRKYSVVILGRPPRIQKTESNHV